MFRVNQSPTNYRNRSAEKFQDVIRVYAKFSKDAEFRTRQADGSTCKLNGSPVFETMIDADLYIDYAEEIDSLKDRIKDLEAKQSAMKVQVQGIATESYRSNKPSYSNMSAMRAFNNAGGVEELKATN